MGQIKIQESTIQLTNGKTGKVAVLIYSGEDDPVIELDRAVSEYVRGALHYQFIDMDMENPWIRVILWGINDINQVDFDSSVHKLKP